MQYELEQVIDRLVSEFLQAPYKFFTEADAVARFHQLLETYPVFQQPIPSLDGHQIPLIHREYPTFFRFEDANPVARLDDSAARRGHYDTVILNPDFIRTHNAETIKNRNIKAVRDATIQPLKAILEFKLDDRGWSSGRTKGAVAELAKLHLSASEAPLRYLVVLMRYIAPNLYRWTRYWPVASNAAAHHPDIRSVFAVQWPLMNRGPEVHHFGQWISTLNTHVMSN